MEGKEARGNTLLENLTPDIRISRILTGYQGILYTGYHELPPLEKGC